MDDITLKATLGDGTKIYVSPLHADTYREFIEDDALGGSSGYFITRERRGQFEVLAKAANIDAAMELFEMLTDE